MKYCPQCYKQFTESWLIFCSDDGAPLITDLSPPANPNWDPRIREPQVKSPPSEQETQWLPPPAPGGWIAPDERPPMRPGAWTPPAPPPVAFRPKQPSQGLALASMITSLIGLAAATCLGPVPGIVGVVLGLIALSQIKKSPTDYGGKQYATAGIVIGSINIAFYILLLIWFLLALLFG